MLILRSSAAVSVPLPVITGPHGCFAQQQQQLTMALHTLTPGVGRAHAVISPCSSPVYTLESAPTLTTFTQLIRLAEDEASGTRQNRTPNMVGGKLSVYAGKQQGLARFNLRLPPSFVNANVQLLRWLHGR